MNEISMPVVALRGLTILPEMVVHFDVSRECSINAVNAAMEEEGQKIFLTTQKDPEIDMPEAEDLHKIGCVAVIKQIIKLPKNILRVLVAGEYRAEFTEFETTDPYYRAIICELPDENQLSDLVAVQADNPKIQGMCRSLQELYNNFIKESIRVYLFLCFFLVLSNILLSPLTSGTFKIQYFITHLAIRFWRFTYLFTIKTHFIKAFIY